MADMLYIYPMRKDKKSFDNNKEELGFGSKPLPKKKETNEEFLRRMNEKLEQERFKMYCDFGIIGDFKHRFQNIKQLEANVPVGLDKKEQIDKNKIEQQFKLIEEKLPSYK
jgi:hypothetical protein